jgi:hypothetical protein
MVSERCALRQPHERKSQPDGNLLLEGWRLNCKLELQWKEIPDRRTYQVAV